MMTDLVYGSLLSRLLSDGSEVTTRNSRCRRLRCVPVTFASTPLVCVRATAWKNALRELEWFLSGDGDDFKFCPEQVRPWWQPWVNKEGRIPFNYGHQLRGESGVNDYDQIAYLLNGVKSHPFSRRNLISTWDTEDMADPECPITNCWGTVLQAFVEPADDTLHLVTYQRSADAVCGVPHNWLQMWGFLLWLAHRTGRAVGSLQWVGGDVHLYEVHEDLAGRIVAAVDPHRDCPELVYEPTSEDFRADDFSLSRRYDPDIRERAEMVV